MSAIGRRRELVRTNDRQFEVEILGLRLPSIGEVFEIETQNHLRYEVECVDLKNSEGLLKVLGTVALVERTDDGPALKDVRSRVISDLKAAPPASIYEERTFRHTSTLEMLGICSAAYEDDEPRSKRWVDDPWFDKEPEDDSINEPYAREGDDDY